MTRKKTDYRAWARKHFKDASAMLPEVYGGYSGKKYVPTDIKKEVTVNYNTQWICVCSRKETVGHSFEKLYLAFNKLLFVACPRCTCPMKFEGIEENFFKRFYLYYKCLLRNLKKRLENRLKET